MLFWQRNDNLNLLSVGTEVIHRKRSLPTADEYVKPFAKIKRVIFVKLPLKQ
jgi:hypothetical protein